MVSRRREISWPSLQTNAGGTVAAAFTTPFLPNVALGPKLLPNQSLGGPGPSVLSKGEIWMDPLPVQAPRGGAGTHDANTQRNACVTPLCYSWRLVVPFALHCTALPSHVGSTTECINRHRDRHAVLFRRAV